MNSYEKRKFDFLKKLEDIGKFKLVGDFKNYREEETIFKCNDCGFEFKSTREKILKRKFCPNCKGYLRKKRSTFLQKKRSSLLQKKDQSPLCETRPKLSEHLLDKKDSEFYAESTTKLLKWICPICGIIFEKSPRRIEGEYVCCKGCSDNYSQPNKYFYSFLRELGIVFEIEKIFNWSKFENRKNFKYDFYIESKNMIIEVMGIQHYPFDGLYYKTSYLEQHSVDIKKERLANVNGISFYVKIDARNSDFKFLKNSIIQEMSHYFNLDSLNWENINLYATKSFMKEICELYNSGQYMVMEISKKMKLEKSTVSRYLKYGSNIGICSYNIENTLEIKKNVKTKFYNKRLNDNFRDVCDYYNSLPIKLVSYVENRMESFSRKFIIRCLEKGNEFGLCNYNKDTVKSETLKACRSRCNRGKAILQKDSFGNIIKEYQSLKEASKSICLHYSKLSRIITKRINYNGFVFEYKNKTTKLEEAVDFRKTSIKVDQFTKDGVFLKTYKSINDAFRQTGIPQDGISRTVSGKYKNSGGFIWKRHKEC
jgi:rubrerythrin